MDLFDRPMYLYGKIIKKKLVTPYKSYEINLPGNLKADYLPVRVLNGKVEVFFSSDIFNSYVVSEEENLKTLFSPDNKLTVTKEEVEQGRIYTFVVEKEDENIRRVSLYKFDSLYPGSKTQGRVTQKKGKYFVSTVFGEGDLVLQNNSYGKKVEVLLYRKDEGLHFVQVDNPVKTKVRVKVDSYDSSSGYYMVSDRNIKGILFTGTKLQVGSSLDCIPKDNNLGFYIFEEFKDLSVGQEIEAEVLKEGEGVTALKYGGHKGFIKGKVSGRKVKGKIVEIKEEVFELASKRKMKEKKIPLSIPFDIPSEEEEKEIDPNSAPVNLPVSLDLERKRSKCSTEEDFLMEIKAHPGKAFPILKLFKFLLEQNRPDEANESFYEFLPSLTGKEREDLAIAYVNYLIYSGYPDLYKTVKKLSQTCSMRFLEVVSSNTDNLEVAKLYYTTHPNRNSFKTYLGILFSTNLSEAYKLMEENPKYLYLAIPFLYKFGDNPRNRIEGLITKNREAWFEYLNHESGEYKRHLFRRVVDYDWNKKDMKKFFKMWLDFETEVSGDVEEVRSRAKVFVEKIKTKEA